jgi:hypothetical protein
MLTIQYLSKLSDAELETLQRYGSRLGRRSPALSDFLDYWCRRELTRRIAVDKGVGIVGPVRMEADDLTELPAVELGDMLQAVVPLVSMGAGAGGELQQCVERIGIFVAGIARARLVRAEKGLQSVG